MKKFISLLLMLVMVASLFVGCQSPKSIATMNVKLSEQPMAAEKQIDLNGAGSLEITFELDKAGFIKMSGYDNTEYEEYPEYSNKIKLVYTDSKGKTLYEIEDISNGYTKETRFDAGKVTATITYDERFEDMKQLVISWAFAPDTNEATPVAVDGATALSAVKNKQATFTFDIAEEGLYNVNVGEACVYDWDSILKVETADGQIVAENVSIHETEWGYRKFFLTKGQYKITADKVECVARCTVKRQEEQPNNVLTEVPKKMILATSPIAIGFVNTNGQVIEATFKAGSSNRLQINADGLGTFYDSEQSFDLVITNSRGKIVLEEEYCESGMYDISSFKGEHKIKLTPHGNGIYQLCLTTYNPED